jgi:hypothetical protein
VQVAHELREGALHFLINQVGTLVGVRLGRVDNSRGGRAIEA